jgi:hypothetical protein
LTILTSDRAREELQNKLKDDRGDPGDDEKIGNEGVDVRRTGEGRPTVRGLRMFFMRALEKFASPAVTIDNIINGRAALKAIHRSDPVVKNRFRRLRLASLFR